MSTFTVAEAAQQLGITEKAVRRRIERGVLPSVLGPDRKRRIPVSAVDPGKAGALAPRVPQPNGHAPLPAPDLLDRLERLARENGQLRQIEQVAGQARTELFRAHARIRELEAQLATRRRRAWWRRV